MIVAVARKDLPRAAAAAVRDVAAAHAVAGGSACEVKQESS